MVFLGGIDSNCELWFSVTMIHCRCAMRKSFVNTDGRISAESGFRLFCLLLSTCFGC